MMSYSESIAGSIVVMTDLDLYLFIYFTEPLQSHLGEAVKFCKTVIFNSGI